MEQPLWKPSAASMAASNMRAFMREAGARYGIEFADYAAV